MSTAVTSNLSAPPRQHGGGGGHHGGHHGGGGRWHGRGGGWGGGYGYGYPVVEVVEPDIIYTPDEIARQWVENPCISPQLFANPKAACDAYSLQMRRSKLRGFGDAPAATPALATEEQIHAGEWHIPGVPYYLDPLNLVQQTWYPHYPATEIGAAYGIAISRGLSALGAVALGWYVHKKTKSVPKAAAGAVVGSAIGPLALSIWEHNRG